MINTLKGKEILHCLMRRFFSITSRIGIIEVLDQKDNRKKVKTGERKMGERLIEGDS